ncbi:unnamed protein product [Protopolystoma xenopodis]|uniref:Uncharacterized protein n=1 Tax=Protopolystoma xenopodis TaxID=117903 RepID=A0A3S5FDI0_9PLAT|nr:unnamed protein product [Protopolystoma xenopodis]
MTPILYKCVNTQLHTYFIRPDQQACLAVLCQECLGTQLLIAPLPRYTSAGSEHFIPWRAGCLARTRARTCREKRSRRRSQTEEVEGRPSDKADVHMNGTEEVDRRENEDPAGEQADERELLRWQMVKRLIDPVSGTNLYLTESQTLFSGP